MTTIATGLPDDRGSTASDVAMWDAVAAIRVYDVTQAAVALTAARSNYAAVTGSTRFAFGACPRVDYQFAGGAGGHNLKTLETDANRILAGVLLSQRVADTAEAARDLADAETLYAAVRETFLDRRLPLYTVYVFDDGRSCTQLPHRFFASVNGRMIEAGLALAAATGKARYLADTRATTHAVGLLSDARGIFADLQAENDVVAPLVLAMSSLARTDRFARDWITGNAAAAVASRAGDGTYPRFFDGPPPRRGTSETVWQTNGGFALAIAAAALQPKRRVDPNPWIRAVERATPIAGAPSSYTFTGSGLALIGPLPSTCRPEVVGPCESGHVHVLIDGKPMLDETGIWQGKAFVYPGGAHTVLFAWRWPATGRHTVSFAPTTPDDPNPENGKEGAVALDVESELVLP
jgi:hypothetical protein